MQKKIGLGLAALNLVAMSALALAGCGGNNNQFPEDFRGTYEMSRLLGTDNAQITVGTNSLTMAECDVNCPDLTMTFTRIECTTESAGDTCTVESADCTGTITEGLGVTRNLEIELTAKPGLTGEAAEHRQVNCYQHSGNISQAS
jgi:hypothetical protein